MNQREGAQWNRLDNAAKIFPPTSNKRDTKVFRFACELTQPVRPALLQKALEETLEEFPIFLSVIKRGLFWYYLEKCPLRPQAEEENTPPLARLYDPNIRNLLFRVSYWDCRISFEVYHALTDGTGALQFLRTLTCRYLAKAHGEALEALLPLPDLDSSSAQKGEDSFQKYYSKKQHEKKAAGAQAYRIRGTVLPENRLRVVEGVLPVPQVLAAAKARGVTLTAFLGGVLLCAVGGDMALRHRGRPVRMDVPVNLRNHFESATSRNFFGVINVGYDFSAGDAGLDEVVAQVARQLEQELTPERLSQRMSALTALEHNMLARAIPLVVKDITLKVFYRLAQRDITVAFSNLGRIQMPKECRPYIRRFDVFASTDKLQACLCSYEDVLTVSFTTPFVSTEICKRFFRTLTAMGIPVEIVSNLVDEEVEA